jgi:AP-2 complex subunit alpha
MPKNVQQNNAQNAVLFEAINLVIHLDTEHELMVAIVTRLGKFIQSRETNVRYLGLDAMTHFAARADTLDPIRKHQNIILGSLRDRDISVRRKGLDLIYSMCDPENAQPIVNELMRYLQTADYAIREEMVLKIAILTEKYATDVQWYVDVSLRLIAMAGDHVSDEVWQRIVQIVTNNEDLQVYATQNILEYIKLDQCHETIIKIGGYLLGEYGHLIADNPGCSPIEQLISLQAKISASSTSTRAIILSSFVKFVNLFPEIKPQLLQAFRVYSHAIDAELQQRACEYLALATLPTDDLLRTVCDEMPPFPERTSALLSRLHAKHGISGDRRTWVVGGKAANTDPKEILVAQRTGLQRSLTLTNGTNGSQSPTNGSQTSPTNGTNGHGLEGLHINGDSTVKTPKTPNFASAAHLSPGWEAGYKRLLFSEEGVLYQDTQIQIGLRSEYRGSAGIVILYFTNRTSSPMGSLTTTLDTSYPDQLLITTKNLPDPSVLPDGQSQQTVMFEAKSIFPEAPTIRISYLAGSLQAITLRLPIMIHKFMEPATLTGDDFFKRWKQIGGAPREAQRIFGMVSKSRIMDHEHTQTTTEKFKWGILKGVDPNSKNIVGACVIHTKSAGKFGCLMRLEPNYETRVCYFLQEPSKILIYYRCIV